MRVKRCAFLLVVGSLAAELGCTPTSAPAPLRANEQPAAGSPRLLVASSPSVILDVETSTRTRASAHDAPTDTRTGNKESTAQAQGRESLRDCNGRHSAATAQATATATERGASTSIRLSVAVHANGGHYLEGPCFLRQGHDTEANASASSDASILVRFSNDLPSLDYEIRVRSTVSGTWPADGVKRIVRVEGPDGAELGTGSNVTVSVTPVPDGSFRVVATVESEGGNRGACCAFDRSGTATFDVEVVRAPIIARGLEVVAAQERGVKAEYDLSSSVELRSRADTRVWGLSCLMGSRTARGFLSRPGRY
jgi:hypothetical protein